MYHSLAAQVDSNSSAYNLSKGGACRITILSSTAPLSPPGEGQVLP